MAVDDEVRGRPQVPGAASDGPRGGPSAAQWSITALASLSRWPWQWNRAPLADFDPGPGRRSGFGSLTALPYVLQSMARKVRPDDPPTDAS